MLRPALIYPHSGEGTGQTRDVVTMEEEVSQLEARRQRLLELEEVEEEQELASEVFCLTGGPVRD